MMQLEPKTDATRLLSYPAAPQLLLLSFLFLVTPITGLAQNTNSGEIRGTVTDVSGGVVPGVNVIILNNDTGVTKDLLTNQDGVYDAVSILPGHYEITFTKPGFGKLVRSGINLIVGLTEVNAQLAVGTAQQQISVTAEVPLLQTENGEQSTTLEAQSMQQLPNVGQSWLNFTKILPGAAGSGSGVVVNGNMPFYNNFLANGSSITMPHSGNMDPMVFEDVAEVQMNTSTFSAEYAVGGAVFNEISKSGTNDWHGSAYEYIENDALNARNFFASSVPLQRWDNYGGTIGGPILKNKFFFFFNIDQTHNIGGSVYTDTFPTAAMRNGNFSDLSEFPVLYEPNTLGQGLNGGRIPFPNNQIPASMMDPLAVRFQSMFPEPNVAGYSNNWTGLLDSQYPLRRWFGRLDYNLSDKNRLTFSIHQGHQGQYNPQPYAVGAQIASGDMYQAQISDVYTISPNTVNEFRVGFTREANLYVPASLNQNFPQNLGWNYAEANLPPTLEINGNPGISTIGPGTNAQYIENVFDTSDSVTMIRGRHILKFGGEILALQDNDTPWGNINAGNFTFSGVFTQQAPNASGGLGYADFLLGEVTSWNAGYTPSVSFREKVPQFFIQDDFKVTPHLTVNFGLRYQIQGGWSEVYNRAGTFDPNVINPATNTLGAMWFAGQDGHRNVEANLYDIFLPRVGFAWAPKNNWVIRGGFGMYDAPWSLDTYGGDAEGVGYNYHGSMTSTDQINPVFFLSQATQNTLNYVGPNTNPASYNGQSPFYDPYHVPMLTTYQWSFNIQRQFGGGFMAEAAYVGNHGTNEDFIIDENQVPSNLLLQSVANPANAQNLRPFPQFESINAKQYPGVSNYHALQLSAIKRFSHGIQFDVNYTWSKMLDDQDSSGGSNYSGGQLFQDSYNPSLNYGQSNFSLPQMFKGDLVYDLPFGKGRTFLNSNAIVDLILGGWQLGTLFVLESGAPFTATLGATSHFGTLSGSNGCATCGNAFGDEFPDLIGNPYISNPSVGQWFNTCTILLNGSTFPSGCTNPAWAVPAPGHFGTEGRNVLRGPGIEDVDISLAKNFRFPLLHETATLQIRFDAMDALNHPNFAAPNASVGISGAGTITSTTGNYGSSNNTFDQRTIQLGARFSF